jgi:aspartokinase
MHDGCVNLAVVVTHTISCRGDNMKMTDQIVQIVAAGGGVIVDSSKMTEQLIEIAATAARSGALVIVRGAGSKMTDQLVQIAAAGKGRVIFDLTKE